jgi:hypothetical protein
MPEELRLPAIATVLLISGLLCALRQARTGKSTTPTLVWRDATAEGWSEWHSLRDVSMDADHSDVLTAVRTLARDDATAVQFGIVAHPADAPDYTLRVLYMSHETPASPDRGLAATP